MKNKYEIIVSRKKIFYYNRLVRIQNGQTILTSETYYSKGNAIKEAKKASKELNIPWRLV